MCTISLYSSFLQDMSNSAESSKTRLALLRLILYGMFYFRQAYKIYSGIIIIIITFTLIKVNVTVFNYSITSSNDIKLMVSSPLTTTWLCYERSIPGSSHVNVLSKLLATWLNWGLISYPIFREISMDLLINLKYDSGWGRINKLPNKLIKCSIKVL